MGFKETAAAYEAECGMVEAGGEQSIIAELEPAIDVPERDTPASVRGC